MTEEEHEKHWKPARDKMDINHTSYNVMYKASRKLAIILDIPYPKPAHWREIYLTEDLKYKLKMLAGPYSETIAKMLVVEQNDRA